jgi:hypothetical protein
MHHTDSANNPNPAEFIVEKKPPSKQKLTNGNGITAEENKITSENIICKTKSTDEDDDEMLEDEEIEDEEVDDEEEEESGSPGYDLNHMDNLDEEHDEKNDETVLVPVRELATIKANLQLLNHQVRQKYFC